MSQKTSSTVRNPAIELYRVLLMFLIVLHHAAYHGHWNHAQGLDTAYPSIYWIFTALTIWHVDGFISITGWFGTRFSLVRFAKLWGVIAFYSVFSIAYGWATCGNLSVSYFAGGWFGCTYLFFLFIAPFLNTAIEKILSLPRKERALVLALLNGAVFLNWAPYQLLTFVSGAGAGSMSVFQFIIIYVNMRCIKKLNLYERIAPFHCLCIAAGFIIITVLLKVVLHWDSWYDAPHVMAMAAASLIVFDRFVKVPQKIGALVLRLSPLMFGVYVLHETTTFGRLIYLLPQDWILANHPGICPLIIIVCTSILCFVFCVVIDVSRRVCSIPLSRLLVPRLKDLDKTMGLS